MPGGGGSAWASSAAVMHKGPSLLAQCCQVGTACNGSCRWSNDAVKELHSHTHSLAMPFNWYLVPQALGTISCRGCMSLCFDWVEQAAWYDVPLHASFCSACREGSCFQVWVRPPGEDFFSRNNFAHFGHQSPVWDVGAFSGAVVPL